MERPGPQAAAPEELLEQSSRLRALARELVRDPGTADDLVQRTLVTAVQRPPRNASALRAWLDRVLRRQVRRDREQHRGRMQRETRAARPEAVPSAEEVAARLELSRELSAAVAELPESQRIAIWMRFFEALPPRTIARRLDVPVETVRTRIKRGLATLRGRLEAKRGAEWRAAYAPFALPLAGWSGFAAASSVALGAGVLWMNGKIAVVALAAALGAFAWWMMANDGEPSGLVAPKPSLAAEREVPPNPGEHEEGESTERHLSEGDVETPPVEEDSDALPAGYAEIRGRFVEPSGAGLAGLVFELAGHQIGAMDRARFEQEATSAEDGSFVFRFECVPARALALSVAPEGWSAVRWVWSHVEAGSRHDLGEIEATPSATILARVVDSEGRPLDQEWKIWASNGGEGAFHKMNGRGMAYDFGGVERSSLPLQRRPGVFEISGIHPGLCRVRAMLGVCKTESQEIELKAGEVREMDLSYLGKPPSSLLALRFVGRTGRPKVAHVWLEGSGIEARHPNERYRYEGLEPGSYVLRVDDPRFETIEQAGLQPGPELVRVTLRGNSSLSLSVTDQATGMAIEEYAVFQKAPFRNRELLSKTKREGGIAKIDDLSAADYDLIVRAEGYPDTEVAAHELQPQEERELSVALGLASRISGKVLRKGGEIADGGFVQLYLHAEIEEEGVEPPVMDERFPPSDAELRRRSRMSKGFAFLGDDATFAFEDVKPGRYLVKASYGSTNFATAENLVVVPGENHDGLELRLPHDAWIQVELIGPEGAAPVKLKAQLEKRGPDGEWTLDRSNVCEEDGTLRFGPLAPEEFRVSWSLGNHLNPWQVLEEVQLSEAQEVLVRHDISAAWPGKLQLTLRDADGPLPGRTVGARRPGTSERGFEGETDAEGNALLEYVWGGTVELYAEDSGRNWFHVDPTTRFVAPGGEATMELIVQAVEAEVLFVDAESGEPLAGHRIAAFPDDGKGFYPRTWKTDAKGAVKLHMVAGGGYRIRDYKECFDAALQDRVVSWGRIDFLAESPIDFRWTTSGPEPAIVRVPRLK